MTQDMSGLSSVDGSFLTNSGCGQSPLPDQRQILTDSSRPEVTLSILNVIRSQLIEAEIPEAEGGVTPSHSSASVAVHSADTTSGLHAARTAVGMTATTNARIVDQILI